ncbi:MAG: hypothetical protein ACJAVV_003573 [Alphaproteobacteria bacterium]|jgi:hypothetical protein
MIMKTNSIYLTSLSMLFVSSAYAGVQTIDNTSTIKYDANQYEVVDASVWAAGGPSTLKVDWSLTEKQWDSVFGRPPRARVGVGQVIEGCVLGICAKTGAAAGVELEAYFLPYLKAEMTAGNFNAGVEYAPEVKYQYSGLGVDFFNLETSSGINTESDATYFDVSTSSITVDTGLNINTNLNLFAEACLLGCFVDETYNLASIDFTVPIVRLDTKQSTLQYFAPPTDKAELALKIGAILTSLPTTAEEFAASGLYDTIDFSEGTIEKGPVSVTVHNPFTENATGAFGVDGNADNIATASVGGDLLDVRLDVDQVLGYAFGLSNGAKLSLEDAGITNAPFTAEIDLAGINVGPSIDLVTDLALETTLMVELEFSAPVLIKGKIGPQTKYVGAWDDLPEFALLAPDASKILERIEGSGGEGFSIDESFQFSEVVTAKPRFFVESSLSNRTYLDVTAGIEGELLSLTVGIDGFAELEIGPVLEFAAQSDSLAQLNIYNDTFKVNDWNLVGDRNIGATVSFENGNTPDTPLTPTPDMLSFDSAGEVMFQARRVKEEGDIGEGDGRIAFELATSGLMRNEVIERGYGYRPVRGTGITVPDLFNFADESVLSATIDEYKIDVGQHGQVMIDGLFGADEDTKLVVELGASLELAAKSPYAGHFENDVVGGVGNFNTFEVNGDVYMGEHALQNAAQKRFFMYNKGDVNISNSGSVKFDGLLKNESEGSINNRGRLELNGTAGESKGLINNQYGGEFDMFGKLTQTDASITNTGTLTLYEGAEIVSTVSSGPGHSSVIANNGELIIEEGASVVLKQTSFDGSYNYLTNSHVIENSGLIWNQQGNQIINGRQGHDWEAFRDDSNPLERAKATRDNALSTLNADLADKNQEVVNNAVLSAVYKTNFLSGMNAYITAAETRLSSTRGHVSGYVDAMKPYQKREAEALDLLRTAQEQRRQFGSLFDSIVAFYQEKYDDAVSATAGQAVRSAAGVNFQVTLFKNQYEGRLRDAESNYGNAIRDLAQSRSEASDIYASIDAVLEEQANTGLGILVNKKGGVLENDGSLINHSIMLNNAGGEIFNSGYIGGALKNNGYLRNSGLLVNEESGVIFNSGLVENGLKAVRDRFGILNIANTLNLGEFNNKGEVENNDTFSNFGVLISGGADGLITNNGVMTNFSTMANIESGKIVNTAGAELSNNGFLLNTSDITNDGVFNNGQDPRSQNGFTGATFTSEQYRTDTVSFYNLQKEISRTSTLLEQQQEKVNDLVAREGLIKQIILPLTGNPFTNIGIIFQNQVNKTIYLAEKAFAAANTLAARNLLGVYKAKITSDNNAINNLASVTINAQGKAILDSSRLLSSKDSVIQNEGSITNRGLFNNQGTINNTKDGVIANSGVMLIGKNGLVNNDGTLSIDSTTVNTFNQLGQAISYDQSGILVSNGVINNNGLIDVSAGKLINGTLEGHEAVINNAGNIVLSSEKIGVFVDAKGNKTFDFETSSLVNNGRMNNLSGGNIKVGTNNTFVMENELFALNTFTNTGEIVNSNGASIENHGVLNNAGSIDNQVGSTFTSNGILNNAKSGTIDFAEAATLGAYVRNSGIISVLNDETLTLTGNVSGSGRFNGNTAVTGMLNDMADIEREGKFTASINAGDGVGILTFDGDLAVSNVNWIMEIWDTERGLGYDGVDILGDFTMAGDMSLTILALLDFDGLISQDFNFLSVAGDLFSSDGEMISDPFAFLDFSASMEDSWMGEWGRRMTGGWDLTLSFIADDDSLYADLRASAGIPVSTPATLMFVLLGFAALGARARSNRANAKGV